MKKVALFLAHGTEEGEAVIHIDLYRRAGIETTTFSIEETLEIDSAHNVTITADDYIRNMDIADYDMLFVPGGGKGVERMYENEILSEALTAYNQTDGILGAVCAGPTVLGKLGLLDGKNATVFPGWEDRLGNANYINEPVIIDGKTVTAKGLGACIPQALKLIETLVDKETADRVKDDIQYPFDY